MSVAVVVSTERRWDVKNWVFHQFFDDIRAANPANQKLQEYLEQLEPLLFDDLRSNRDDLWVGQIYHYVAKQIVDGNLATNCSDELRPAYAAALQELVEILETDGRFAH
jgi:hypothetical protein